uniref:Uncharacterized protein n=1 Tax=Manihot esculenta TaxID=3983 RepID=A0A2C9WIL2_MANES
MRTEGLGQFSSLSLGWDKFTLLMSIVIITGKNTDPGQREVQKRKTDTKWKIDHIASFEGLCPLFPL